MNELITVSLMSRDISALAQFPQELMTPTEVSIVSFIFSYTNEFGRTPSVKRVIKEVPAFIPFFEDDEGELPPVGDLAKQELNNKLVEFAIAKTERALSQLSAGGGIPLETFSEIERMVALSTGIAKYTTFDRSIYFRRKALDFPFRIINRYIRGVGKGDFMLLIGRLGTGKSTLAQFVSKSWFEQGKKILYVSCEMLAPDIFSRIDAMVGKFNPLSLREPEAEETMRSELMKVFKSIREDGRGEIFVPITRIINPSQVGAIAKNLDVDVIIVDGIYLMQPTDHFTSKWEKVATISNELKQIALELEKPLVGITQIKRGAGSEDTYDPEDIAYSDALGQDSDQVIAIKKSKAVPERAELQLIKNRFGPLGVTSVYFDFDKMTIVDEAIAGAVTPEPKKLPTLKKGKSLIPAEAIESDPAEEYHEIGGEPTVETKKPKVAKPAKLWTE